MSCIALQDRRAAWEGGELRSVRPSPVAWWPQPTGTGRPHQAGRRKVQSGEDLTAFKERLAGHEVPVVRAYVEGDEHAVSAPASGFLSVGRSCRSTCSMDPVVDLWFLPQTHEGVHHRDPLQDHLPPARARVAACGGHRERQRTCRVLGVSRTRYYEWKHLAERYGLEPLILTGRRRPQLPGRPSGAFALVTSTPPSRTSAGVEVHSDKLCHTAATMAIRRR